MTSGAPSPTLGVPIAMAYVEPEAARQAADAGDGTGRLAVDVRGRAEPGRAGPAAVLPAPGVTGPAAPAAGPTGPADLSESEALPIRKERQR